MEGIGIRIPEKVFFSNAPANYTVKNDFYFTIFKTNPNKGETLAESTKVHKGEVYPTIYIKGFEQLFKDDGSQADKLRAFFKMFNANGNPSWEIRYGKFRETNEDCVEIITSADSLKPDFSAGFQLSDKCAFTNIPDTPSPVTFSIFIDDFDYFFSDLPNQITYNITLERGFAAYIEDFAAYLTEESEKPKAPVSSIYKGDSCDISWKIEQNEKASAFLYDENGNIVANLPPYTVKIDNDRKFTLTAYNDFCSVTKSLIVYRTLWKHKENAAESFPQTDSKGHFKFYKSYGGKYYLYVHPTLYCSDDDLKTWKPYSENTAAPSYYSFYSSAFSESIFSVCYLSAGLLTYCEMSIKGKTWEKYDIQRSGLTHAYTLFFQGKMRIMLADENDAGFFDWLGGQLMNGTFLVKPGKTKIKAVDVLSDSGKCFVAVLYNNNRVYFYDLDDDFKNNIFECPDASSESIHLIKSNAVYIALDGYMIEVSDREKFTDTHFFPKYKKGTHPILGGADTEAIIGAFQTETGINIWEYKF